MSAKGKILRLATYMCPGIPVEYYEFLAEYLEQELGLHTELLYSSRSRGPDPTRGDEDRIDLAFVSTVAYLEKYKSSSSNFQLLSVGAETIHPTKGPVLGYYSDILVHRDVRERVKEFYDIRGCKFVHARENSLASNRLVLRQLKQMGEDASFFGDIQGLAYSAIFVASMFVTASGDHMSSIEMVVSKKAEVAVVDSHSLANYLTRHYYQKPELHVQVSWGPLPPHPIIINTRIPGELRQRIEEALLNLHKKSEWRTTLEKFSITSFQKLSFDNYLEAIDILDSTKSLSFGITYY
ncbi:hypothetical protein GWK47_018114 [Chionoecetes opilio]|uniref:Uncharacterized protein n=1 Tax=Chionoecetes opilio TaxID=41210 RepID=A0A8J4XQM6_CHIOP|nr:hypothetical protein GWK47_018114 [Chionoecetes opilio]KAG0712612.1 hypothetical protein GWK47_018114 [Chionoecetes opilio]